MAKLPPIRACIFDSDGLLINSEDIYSITINKVLHEYGVSDIPWSIKATQQSRGRQVGKPFLLNLAHCDLIPLGLRQCHGLGQAAYIRRGIHGES